MDCEYIELGESHLNQNNLAFCLSNPWVIKNAIDLTNIGKTFAIHALFALQPSNNIEKVIVVLWTIETTFNGSKF